METTPGNSQLHYNAYRHVACTAAAQVCLACRPGELLMYLASCMCISLPLGALVHRQSFTHERLSCISPNECATRRYSQVRRGETIRQSIEKLPSNSPRRKCENVLTPTTAAPTIHNCTIRFPQLTLCCSTSDGSVSRVLK